MNKLPELTKVTSQFQGYSCIRAFMCPCLINYDILVESNRNFILVSKWEELRIALKWIIQKYSKSFIDIYTGFVNHRLTFYFYCLSDSSIYSEIDLLSLYHTDIPKIDLASLRDFNKTFTLSIPTKQGD